MKTMEDAAFGKHGGICRIQGFIFKWREREAYLDWVTRAEVIGLIVCTISLATCPAQARAAAKSTANSDKRVASIVADWETLPSIFDDIDIYTAQIRELVEIGDPAVPALAAALDHTTRDASMRLLAFTLRAVGDPRAVPALIRAIPKTLLPPGSDCAMSTRDADLLRFMLENDLNECSGGERMARRNFEMDRPVREVCGTLRKITGTHLNESDVYLTFLDGGEQQRAAERKKYHEVARQWADWWETNWNRFVDDPALADARLAPLKQEAVLGRILTGPSIKTSEGMDGMTVAPLETGRHCCLALVLNRTLDVPKTFLDTNNTQASVENVMAWAARAGVDLVGTQYRDPQSGKLYNCLRGVGLQAWEIPDEHWAKIKDELEHGTLPTLDSPTGDLLMHYDEAQGRFIPERKATFLFITRDGLQGILRVTAQVTRVWTPRDLGFFPAIATDNSEPEQTRESGPELGVKLDYKLFYAETEEIKAAQQARRGEATARDEERLRRKMTSLMAKYPHLSGKVYLPDGHVAANAAVLLNVRFEAAILGDRRFELADRSTLVHSAADGSFVLPRVPDARTVYAVHGLGFAELNFDDSATELTVRLAPWGRLEGTMTLEGKPAPHQKVGLISGFASPGANALSLSPGTFTTESDDQGHFVFEHMPPMEVQVCRVVNGFYYEAQFVQIAPGKTVFQHGFNGRMVKGRLVPSDSSSQIEWNGGLACRFSTKSITTEPPAGEESRAWMEKYWQSAEGKQRQRDTHNFPVRVQANGNFVIEDVPPGNYQLSGQWNEGGASPFPQMGRTLGRVSQEVILPKLAAGQSNEPLDLGEVVVQTVKYLKPGDAAPDFEVKTIAGGSLRLADFRGKYLLLDFWATWCGPCRAETPNLKAVYDSYGNHPKFAMLGLSLDKTVEAPSDYASKQGIRWQQGFLGEMTKAKLPGQYGVEGIPAIFLLDPAGKVVATDLRGAGIAKAVGTALDGLSKL